MFRPAAKNNHLSWLTRNLFNHAASERCSDLNFSDYKFNWRQSVREFFSVCLLYGEPLLLSFLSIGHSIFLYSCKMYIQLTFDCFKHLCKECWATSSCVRHNYNLKILSVIDAWNIETNNHVRLQNVESNYKFSRIGNLCVLCWQGVRQLSEGSDVHGDLVQDWYNLHNANSRII